MWSQRFSQVPESSTRRVDWGTESRRALRTFAAVTAAAVASAFVVGGLGGRLAMGLLAAKNPEDHGRLTDDGFVMGQLTVGGTVNLVVAAIFLGLLGSLFYLALRGLLVGPLLVSPEGVDFTLLDPPLLPIGLFVAIPVLYVAMLVLLAHRFLRPTSWFATGDLRLIAVVTAALWIPGLPLLPLVVALVLVWAAWERVRSTGLAAVVRSPATRWAARGLLAVVFGAAVISLSNDIQTLV